MTLFSQRFASVGSSHSCARPWHKVIRPVVLTMAIPKKRQASTFVLWLEVVFVAAAGVLPLPCDEAVRAAKRIQRTLAHAADTAALRKLCGLLEHVRGVWMGPPSWMHGLYHYLRSDSADPTSLLVAAMGDTALPEQLHVAPRGYYASRKSFACAALYAHTDRLNAPGNR
eukprot:200484-Pleurochrysis_carterae.AAC.3